MVLEVKDTRILRDFEFLKKVANKSPSVKNFLLLRKFIGV